MATDRVALTRPWSIASITNAATLGDLGGSHVHYSATGGTHWSFLAILKLMETAFKGTFASCAITINSDYKVVITPGSSQALSFGNGAFRDSLGFTGDRTAATSHTANHVCEYLWVSTYAPSDMIDFSWDQSEIWKGTQAMDGQWCGSLQVDPITLTSNPKMSRALSFVFEPAANAMYSMATEYSYAPKRALDFFVISALSATAADATYPQCTGFQYWWDADDIKTTSYWGDGSAQHGAMQQCSTFKYQYCTCGPGMLRKPEPSLPSGKARYNIGLTIETASPTLAWINW